MNKEEFRAMQAPVKEKYRQDPAAALTTTRVTGRASTGLAFTVESSRGPIEAGPHAATGGGDDTLACAEMLLEALIACSGVTLQSVATAWGVGLRHARIIAEGDVDLRGTLGISKDVPVGFREIRLQFEIDADGPPEKLDKMGGGRAILRGPPDPRSTDDHQGNTSPPRPGQLNAGCSPGRGDVEEALEQIVRVVASFDLPQAVQVGAVGIPEESFMIFDETRKVQIGPPTEPLHIIEDLSGPGDVDVGLLRVGPVGFDGQRVSPSGARKRSCPGQHDSSRRQKPQIQRGQRRGAAGMADQNVDHLVVHSLEIAGFPVIEHSIGVVRIKEFLDIEIAPGTAQIGNRSADRP